MLLSLEDIHLMQPVVVEVSIPISTCDAHQAILSLYGDRMRSHVDHAVLHDLQQSALQDEEEASTP